MDVKDIKHRSFRLQTQAMDSLKQTANIGRGLSGFHGAGESLAARFAGVTRPPIMSQNMMDAMERTANIGRGLSGFHGAGESLAARFAGVTRPPIMSQNMIDAMERTANIGRGLSGFHGAGESLAARFAGITRPPIISQHMMDAMERTANIGRGLSGFHGAGESLAARFAGITRPCPFTSDPQEETVSLEEQAEEQVATADYNHPTWQDLEELRQVIVQGVAQDIAKACKRIEEKIDCQSKHQLSEWSIEVLLKTAGILLTVAMFIVSLIT